MIRFWTIPPKTVALAVWIAAAAAAPAEDPGGAVFATADQCMACHNGLVTPSGEDVSIGIDWRSSMMANSALDPYWRAAVRREVLDHPAAAAAIEHECAACHMPMSRFLAKAAGRMGEVFANLPAGAVPGNPLAVDGVSCTLCHQIESAGLGTRESFTAGFRVDTTTPMGRRAIFGPFDVEEGLRTIMRSASGFVPEEAPHIGSSEHCATCHTLYTHALGPDGEVVGELPEQVPYLEWLHSAYREERGCPSCHMPVVEGEVAASSVLGEPRSDFSRHVFRGGNFFMPGIFNRYRDELGVSALPGEFDAATRRTREHLESESARVWIEDAAVDRERLTAAVRIENLAGHKLPTAYPSRRVWIRFTVIDRDAATVFESGAFNPDGSIRGNVNDADGSRYEPHYDLIDDAEMAQIYETILAGPDGAVTTGLLTAVRYLKDNRLLPHGFDKRTAHEDIAVRGVAADDPDFGAGGDRVRYSVALDGALGPYTVRAELRYQPIAHRWAQNLRIRPSPETDRFVGYYEAMASSSALILASDSVTVAP